MDSGAEEPKPIEVTLNSIAEVVGVSSIRLVGKIRGKEVSYLVDMGYPQFCRSPYSRKIGFTSREIGCFPSNNCRWRENF